MRSLIRDSLTGFFVLFTSPLWLLVYAARFANCDLAFFAACGQAISLLPGSLGAFTRRAFYLMTLDNCARDVGVGFGTWFSKRKVRIAPQVSIGAHCLIGSCTIGQGTLLGSNIDILSGRHQHSHNLGEEPVAASNYLFIQVHIGENVWIGNRAVVMADVGDNSVIGAGSVVVHNIPASSVAVGNPAIVNRQRN